MTGSAAVLDAPRAAARARRGLGVYFAALLPLSRELVLDAVAYLVAAGMLVQSEADAPAARPRFAEDYDPALRGWSRTDLAFHVASTGRPRIKPNVAQIATANQGAPDTSAIARTR